MKDPYLRDEIRITGIRPETADTKTYTFSYLDGRLQKDFAFRPGQFILLSMLGVGEAAFSISSSPQETSTFSTTIRKVGSFTGKLDEYSVGDTLWMGGPFGNGWPMERMKENNVLVIAGGLGILPLWPVLKSIGSARKDFGGIEVLYGARSPSDCLFMDRYPELLAIRDTCLLLTVDNVPEGTSWEHEIGVVTRLFDKMRTAPENTVALICGPETMMHFAIAGLVKRGFFERQIYLSLERRMRCGFGQCGHCQIGPKFVCKDGPVFRYSEIMRLPDLNL
jgi:NAD(P)H-flavin reductase